jgi:hypothetical protein
VETQGSLHRACFSLSCGRWGRRVHDLPVCKPHISVFKTSVLAGSRTRYLVEWPDTYICVERPSPSPSINMDPDEIDRKRPSYLCIYCFEIPPRFWSEECDDMRFPWGKYVRLQPYRSMQKAAAEGCQLCRILLRSAQVDWLDEEALRKEPLTLWRTTIDTHQGVCLVIGNADISHTTFYRVPEPWRESIPSSYTYIRT